MFDNSQVREVSIMTPELRKEGCELKGMNLNEDMSVTFSFVDSLGNKLDQREFMPKKVNEMTDEDLKKSAGLAVSRVAHISRAFLSEEEWLGIKVEDAGNMSKLESNWKKYIALTGQTLKGKYTGVKCTLKVVLKKNKDKYYVSLPQVPPFISTANHPKEFTVNPKYDLFQIPMGIPDTERADQNKAPMHPPEQGFSGQAPVAGVPSGW